MDLIKLKRSAREIRDNWEVIESLEAGMLDHGNMWIREMALQGQRLILVKTTLKHGDWLPWVESNFPGKAKQVQRCMRIAANWTRVSDLTAADSLRQALALCAPEKEAAGGDTKQWPSHIEANSKLSKFVGYLERFPIPTWPDEGKEQAREQLLPVAKALWPQLSWTDYEEKN